MRENCDFVVPVNILTTFVRAMFSWAARVCLDYQVANEMINAEEGLGHLVNTELKEKVKSILWAMSSAKLLTHLCMGKQPDKYN